MKLFLKKLLNETLSLDISQAEKQQYFIEKMNKFRLSRKKKRK